MNYFKTFFSITIGIIFIVACSYALTNIILYFLPLTNLGLPVNVISDSIMLLCIVFMLYISTLMNRYIEGRDEYYKAVAYAEYTRYIEIPTTCWRCSTSHNIAYDNDLEENIYECESCGESNKLISAYKSIKPGEVGIIDIDRSIANGEIQV